jgi:cobalt-zinc-cadmium efflux system outer membrane protein
MIMRQGIIPSIFLLYWCTQNLFAQSPAPLSLQQAVNAYIENSLEVQAANFRLERAKAEEIAARLRPNPGLTISAENLALNGPTPAGRLYEVGATYTETIELGGKRQLREKAADSIVSAAEIQLEDTMRRGVADIKRLYLDALLARANVDIATENRETFDRLLQFNRIRFEEGAIPELELIKVRLERTRFESTIRQADVALRQAVIRLLEKMGIVEFAPRELAGSLDFAPATFDFSTLRQFASTERSDVRAALAALTSAKAKLALERARAKPDLSPFAGYKRIGSDNTVLFGLNIPLKVRDSNQAEIARIESDVKSAEVQLQIIRNHAIAEVEAASVSLQSARTLVDTFRTELLDPADEARTITIAAYEEGGTELLPVLDAQRTRAEVRQQYFKSLFDYQASVIALELAVGKEIQP